MAENEVDQHILDRFEIQQKLGKGQYGVVWRVQEKTPDYATFALKKIIDVCCFC
jgi:mitogen-activated protein kinase 15